MRKTIFTLILCTAATVLSAQTTSDFAKRYNTLVSHVGYDGPGVQTLLDKWARADSTGIDLQVAKFNYHLTKSQRDSVVTRPVARYLGMEPILTLKDSTGGNVYYYKETIYDSDEFNTALANLDMAINMNNTRLDLHALMADALMNFEKEFPDLTVKYLLGMIDRNYTKGMKWELEDGAAEPGLFGELMQSFCYGLFKKGTPGGYEAFRTISEKMLKHDKNNVNFINNVGSYYLVSREDLKTATKYYTKTLKLEPQNEIALKNLSIIERKSKAKNK